MVFKFICTAEHEVWQKIFARYEWVGYLVNRGFLAPSGQIVMGLLASDFLGIVLLQFCDCVNPASPTGAAHSTFRDTQRLDSALQSHLYKIRCSIVVSISACHAEDPGSIPGRGVCRYPLMHAD